MSAERPHFGLYGLYEYWRLTKDERAVALFDGASQTVPFLPQLRISGEPSWCGMRVQDIPGAKSESYHRIHFNQLSLLKHLTDDERFDALSDQLRADFY